MSKKKTAATPYLMTQPADWLAAFRKQAKSEGVKLSIWIGERCKAGLPPEVRKTLSSRVQGRPRKNPE